MIRNVVGSVLALVGATAAVWSPFRAWYDGRHGSDYRIGDLFTGITGSGGGVIASILLPFAFAALVTLVGVVLRSRLLVAIAAVVVLGFTVLWMVRVGQAEGSLVVSGGGRGLGDGVANALGGGLLLLIGALVMSGRPKRRHLEPAADRPHAHPPLDDGPPPAPYGTTRDPYDRGPETTDHETTRDPYATGHGATDRGTDDPYATGHGTTDRGTGDPYATGHGTTDRGTGDPYDSETRSMPYAAPGRSDAPAERPRDPDRHPWDGDPDDPRT
ncbi:hypothetical protein ACFZCF_30425 [Streptomyces sp. NPDC007945]|uniref:hypothetical protein n=1 Tax=Streptomyces sp. NPDC007945 TaxID=3364797 RepID=UPI0036E0DECF